MSRAGLYVWTRVDFWIKLMRTVNENYSCGVRTLKIMDGIRLHLAGIKLLSTSYVMLDNGPHGRGAGSMGIKLSIHLRLQRREYLHQKKSLTF